MPVLKNGKHEKFVKEIFIDNKNNADAYRAVYGEQQSVFAASASANRLLKSDKIMARVAELQAQVAEKHQITVEVMIERLERAAANATADKQHGAVVSALTAQAKLAGLWVDRAENLNGNYAISDKPLSEQEWVEKHVKH